MRWLEEALWCFEDRPDERLERAAAGLMAAAGRGGEAERILWRVFERSPSLAAYRELAALTSEASPEGRATAILESAAERAHRPGPHFNVPAQTLFDLQMAAEAHDAAWRTATRWGVGEHRLRSLADRTCETHRDRAVHTYEFLAESRIVAGGAGNYDDAIKLLGLRAHACADAANQAAYLDGLRLRHKAKRTFVQRLQTLG